MAENDQDWKPFDERPVHGVKREADTTRKAEGWKRGDPIGYIREQVPEIEMPVYAGERYERLVPDSLVRSLGRFH